MHEMQFELFANFVVTAYEGVTPSKNKAILNKHVRN